MKAKRIDISGQRYGRLIALRTEGRSSSGILYWICRCDCGNEKRILGSSLRNGSAKSCGCLQRDWVKEGLPKFQYKKKLPHGVSDRRSKYKSYFKAAKFRNLEFQLSFEFFENITSQDCHYCGSPAVEKKTSKNATRFGACKFNGIDRKDPKIGYIVENCVPCCSKCNFAKGKMGYDEFLRWLANIQSYQIKHFLTIAGDRI